MRIRAKCEEIVRARIRAGMSQRELAARAGLGNGYISQIERGLVNPGPKAARKITEALGADFDSLFEVVMEQRVQEMRRQDDAV